MELEVFGIGAAGNKAAIELIKKGVVAENHVKLLNTTTKDIPDEYKQNSNIVIPFASSVLGGCGKEPAKGRQAIDAAMNSGHIRLEELVQPTTREVILVTSTEGGTGCGATPSIAKRFIALNIPVHVFAFVGFQEDFRSIKNTLAFFGDMDDKVILHVIKNSEFLDYTYNYTSAELLANNEFVKQVSILKGDGMIPSSQNIDDTDMYKVSTTSGYMDIKHIPLTGVKNEELFNKAIMEAYTNSKTFDYDPTAKRVAVIVNASEKTQLAIDDTYTVLKTYTGNPGEFFKHIQNDDTNSEYINIIASGIRIPDKEFVYIKDKFMQERASRENKSVSYNSVFGDLDLDDDDDLDMNVRTMNNPDTVEKFFKNNVKNNPLSEITVANDGIDSEY